LNQHTFKSRGWVEQGGWRVPGSGAMAYLRVQLLNDPWRNNKTRGCFESRRIRRQVRRHSLARKEERAHCCGACKLTKCGSQLSTVRARDFVLFESSSLERRRAPCNHAEVPMTWMDLITFFPRGV
jgi:hypothetical protein